VRGDSYAGVVGLHHHREAEPGAHAQQVIDGDQVVDGARVAPQRRRRLINIVAVIGNDLDSRCSGPENPVPSVRPITTMATLVAC
jgi:hypothetical protein